ncbi:aminotransferase class V-fold PLP-dependent enzyme [Archangium primigenium]|uniref:aminotransferase class V-fold PLP-dependent enzyme n=1 Tax=[Archangium] primigenium TaxID=2792470 RepID=UPI00195B5412|nr:aminotransferase class V-fold PLP-dependent enzyme [Archangium primigenium]MBM7116270.1 aminotransferase class V-fold PLP-dependent enzyme [Archangium primigenium]
MDRRDFLRTGLALGGAALATTTAPGCATATAAVTPEAPPAAPPAAESWEALRAEFDLTHDEVHLSNFLLAPHPRSVRESIEVYRRAFDTNPVKALKQYYPQADLEVAQAIARYLEVKPEEIGLTESTTVGLGLVYSGLRLSEGEEILTSTHEHYSTDKSLLLRAERTGARVRRIPLYTEPESVTEEGLVRAVLDALTPRTRYLAMTWVHSGSGVKLPLRALSEALARVNAGRGEAERVLLCVDGVHGLGAEAESVASLGCDFFMAGCHKWMFGPRGTGFVWGRTAAWGRVVPSVPTFFSPTVRMWAQDIPAQEVAPGPQIAPGGFHAFDHRWSMGKAFELHERLGRARVAERVHALNRQAKEGLAAMKHVRVRTPMADALSSGITCFEVAGHTPAEVVHHLGDKGIVASVSPYVTKYVRLAPGVLNTPADVDAALREIRALG